MAESIVGALGLSEAPIAVYYADEKPEGAFEWDGRSHFCLIGRLAEARKGTPLAVNGENTGCGGSANFLGWDDSFRPGFEYFLSHDEEGKGERFKKTPELARAMIRDRVFVPASGRYCMFQRLADLPEDVQPEVVVMFADPDEVSGLVVLANYGRAGSNEVIAPMTSGCGSIVNEPRVQAKNPQPKAVLGMFDAAARPKMEKQFLTFSVPYAVSTEIVGNIRGSFLEIEPWTGMRDR